MRLLLITDAWSPQTNGVVTTLRHVRRELRASGVDVAVIHPGLFRTVGLPSYPEIRIAINPWRVGRMIRAARPAAIHIATEGPLGIAARLYLARRSIPFCTSLHTKFPEYVARRTGLPTGLGYRLLRWFHRPSCATLVTTASHRRELERYGMGRLVVWGRGVDAEAFAPRIRAGRSRPRLLYVGRIAVEKNLEAFLGMDIDADKVVVGDGPARTELQARYPDADWVGYRFGDELATYYADADVFVFPSRTDTFGLVMLEAMACGTPVAAYPVTGPADVVIDGVNGALDDDLSIATHRALGIPRDACREYALRYSWRVIAGRLMEHLPLIDWSDGAGPSRQFATASRAGRCGTSPIPIARER
jgi:1,2-diacylglycerol 3-alpha-glucosyltransferase/glucuronosyltransferase